MTGPNTPDGVTPEKKEKEKNIKQLNVGNLLKEGIEKEFGRDMDPTKWNAYKKDKTKFHENIAIHMRDIRRINNGEWSGVTDEMIDQECTEKHLSEQILLKGKELVLLRKRIFDDVLEFFPTVEAQSQWESVLRGEIDTYSIAQLAKTIGKKSELRKLVHETFPTLSYLGPKDSVQFEQIFHDGDSVFDMVGKKKLMGIFSNIKKFGQSPSIEELSFILSKYKNVTVDHKKEILSQLGAKFSLSLASDFQLIDDVFLTSLAEKEFGTTFTSLDTPEKQNFIRILKSDTSFLIGAKDLNINNLSSVLSDNNNRRKLSQEIFRSMQIDVSEDMKVDRNDIISRIKKRKQAEAKIKELDEEEDYDMYDEFIEQLDIDLKGKEGQSHIKNLKLLRTPGAVIRFEDPKNGTQFLRVKKVRDEHGFPLDVHDSSGIELEGMPVLDGQLRRSQNFALSYEEFYKFLSESKDPNVLKSEEFESQILTQHESEGGQDGKIYDARAVEVEPVTALNIASKLNLLDPEGTKFGFETGTAFIAPATDEHGKAVGDEVWKVQKIYGDKIDLMDAGGKQLVKGYPLTDFYSFIASTSGFTRIAKIASDDDMLKELKEFGLANNASLKDGKIITEEEDDHHHKKEKEITCFTSTKGGHIRMEYIKGGLVRFGEYDPSGNEESKVKEYAAKHGLDKKIVGLYTWKTMSYPAFLRYLEANKSEASSKDLIVPDAAHDLHGDHHGHHPHLHGSFFKRIMQWQNPATIWKGMEMIIHGIEHTLEKGAKLDAAKFALQTSKFLGLPEDVSAQVYADVVNGSKEIVEKIETKIFGLPGPRGRNKCLHIVENTDSRPEEVAAAMSYMLKSYGHLYSEDIKHKQSLVQSKEHCISAPRGTFLFFDAMVTTSKMGDLHYWRGKCYEKAIAEMGTEDKHEGEPTEEQLIHALCKMIDGKWDEYPYAASVVKAIGGPSGFEKIWKFEGFDNAKKKGVDQTQMVNAQGRLNKAVGYLGTHEIYKAIGAMEAVAGKVKDPEFQAVPFIWCVGGFSRYASPHALQQIKKYAESGFTFHAFAFMRQAEDNVTYTDTVRKALHEVGGSVALDKFDKLRKRLENNPDDKDHTDKAALEMMKFWQEWQGKGLHDMLQGHNGWLLKKYHEGDATIKDYINILDGKHQMQLNDSSIPGNELGKDWFDEHGIRMNRIMTFDKDTGLYSLKRMLNKIRLEGTKTGDRKMNDVEYEKLWDGIKEQIEITRNLGSFGGDTNLQKRQFLVYRREIIDFFVNGLNARSSEPPLSQAAIDNLVRLPHKYWDDLRKMGIDPRAIFDESIESKGLDTDHSRWKDGSSFGTSSTSTSVPIVEDMVRRKSEDTMSRRTPKPMVKPKAGPRMKRSDWKNSKNKWEDDDVAYPGGAADAGGGEDIGPDDSHDGGGHH